MSTRTHASTIGFFLLNVGVLGTLDRFFNLNFSDTWPVGLLSVGVYIVMLPRRQSETLFLPKPEIFETNSEHNTAIINNTEQREPQITKREPFKYKAMKAIFVSLYGVFAITAIVTHIWTVMIAFSEGGFLGGVISLFLPFLAELHWMFKMFGENDTYAYIALAHLLLAVPFSLFGRE